MGRSSLDHKRFLDNMRYSNRLETIKEHIPGAVEALEKIGMSLKDQFALVSKVLDTMDTPEEQLAVVEGQLGGLVLLSDNKDAAINSDSSVIKEQALAADENLDPYNSEGALHAILEIGAKYPDEIPQNLVDKARDMLERTGLLGRMHAQGLSEDEINQVAENLAGYALNNSDHVQEVKREAHIDSEPEVNQDVIDMWSGQTDPDYDYLVGPEDISTDNALVRDTGDLNAPTQEQAAPQEQRFVPTNLQFN